MKITKKNDKEINLKKKRKTRIIIINVIIISDRARGAPGLGRAPLAAGPPILTLSLFNNKIPAVRFGSFPENARFAPVPNLNGSVRFVSPVRFGFLFLTVISVLLLLLLFVSGWLSI